MIRLFKNLTKKEVLCILISIVLIVFQVWLELKLPDYMSSITVLVKSGNDNINLIIKEGSYMLLCAFGSLVCSCVVSFFAATTASSFATTIRSLIFKKIQKYSMNEMKKFSVSSLITRTTNDVTQVDMVIGLGLQMLVKAPIMAVWAIIKILNKGLEWSILTGVCVVILLITIAILMVLVLPKFSIVQKLIDKINSVTKENLSGIRVIRAFNAEEFHLKRFEEVNENLTKTQLFNQRTFAILSPVMTIVMQGLTLGVYIIGAILINNSSLSDKITLFSNMLVFSSYGMQVISSFLMLAVIFMMVPRATISAKRINEILDEKLTIVNGEFKGETDEKGTIEFKNVSFKYPDADEYLIKDISLKIEKGQTVAFIGSTGSGKSTLINLIPRFYDVTKGELLVDDVNVKDYDENNLRNKIGYVSQRAVMFSKSVSENVAYGDNGKEKISIKKIKDAISIAQATDFVEKMECKYDSHISRGGTNISGGQKQRLSIARAIAREPEIYIFDDSFSALDYKTDYILRTELKKYTKDATCIIVAQRIGTIINADKIVVLDNGNLVGVGTHKELLKKCKVYKEIALSQLSKEELENA